MLLTLLRGRRTSPAALPHPIALVYAAFARCSCGLGLAFEPTAGPNGFWDCSGILLGTADAREPHVDRLPFAFYEIKTEQQPSASGATTRPLTAWRPGTAPFAAGARL